MQAEEVERLLGFRATSEAGVMETGRDGEENGQS